MLSHANTSKACDIVLTQQINSKTHLLSVEVEDVHIQWFSRVLLCLSHSLYFSITLCFL